MPVHQTAVTRQTPSLPAPTLKTERRSADRRRASSVRAMTVEPRARIALRRRKRCADDARYRAVKRWSDLRLVLGLVLKNQADFARNYVKDQLGQQKITFTPADKLSDTEKAWKSGSSCLVDNGGKLLESGAHAECYANYYIALHLEEAATNAGYEGATYASIGSVQTDLRNQVASARQSNASNLADLQTRLDAVNALRTTQFQGETLRGLLLTSYGFSIFGERAALAADICFGLALLALGLAIAGFVHAFVTPKSEKVLEGTLAGAGSR